MASINTEKLLRVMAARKKNSVAAKRALRMMNRATGVSALSGGDCNEFYKNCCGCCGGCWTLAACDVGNLWITLVTCDCDEDGNCSHTAVPKCVDVAWSGYKDITIGIYANQYDLFKDPDSGICYAADGTQGTQGRDIGDDPLCAVYGFERLRFDQDVYVFNDGDQLWEPGEPCFYCDGSYFGVDGSGPFEADSITVAETTCLDSAGGNLYITNDLLSDGRFTGDPSNAYIVSVNGSCYTVDLDASFSESCPGDPTSASIDQVYLANDPGVSCSSCCRDNSSAPPP